MAGIGQIKDVTIALRIEHHGVLVGQIGNRRKLFHHSLLLFFHVFRLLFKLQMIVDELCPEYVECGVKIRLFEHCVAGQYA